MTSNTSEPVLKNEKSIKKSIFEAIFEKTSQNFDSFYIYDIQEIQQHCSMFNSIPYPKTSIHFASMANTNKTFLSLIKKNGLQIFVNSPKHLTLAKDIGFKNKEIIFTASALSKQTMKLIHKYNTHINLDSLQQIKIWHSLFPSTPVGIRCNIGSLVSPKNTRAGYFIGSKSRLGLTMDEIKSLQGNPNICGLHLYAGTDIIDIDYFMECYRQIGKIAHYFPNLTYLNLGGGFGIDDKQETIFDSVYYGKQVSTFMEETSASCNKSLALMLEPGRIIGGEAGYFVCKVTDIKFRDNRQFIGVNASSVQFPRPLFYSDSAIHPVSILRNGSIIQAESTLPSAVYGCSTYSRDFLSHNTLLPVANLDDTIIFSNAGSYCSTAHTSFLGFPPAPEYFV